MRLLAICTPAGDLSAGRQYTTDVAGGARRLLTSARSIFLQMRGAPVIRERLCDEGSIARCRGAGIVDQQIRRDLPKSKLKRGHLRNRSTPVANHGDDSISAGLAAVVRPSG